MSWYCDVCRCECPGDVDGKTHCNGSKHKKNMKKAREAARIHKVHHKAKKMLKKKLEAENDAIAQRVQRDATRRLAKHQLKSNEVCYFFSH